MKNAENNVSELLDLTFSVCVCVCVCQCVCVCVGGGGWGGGGACFQSLPVVCIVYR